MLKKIFYYPSKHLVTTIPLTLLAGFLVGTYFNTDKLIGDNGSANFLSG